MAVRRGHFRACLLSTAAVIALTSLAAPRRLAAQVLYGSIVGNVKDSSGAPVPGAEVTIVSTVTKQARQASTNETGGYVFPTLPSGAYDVSVRKEGFAALTSRSRPLNQRFGRTAVTNMVAPLGTGQYNGLQTTLERRFAGGYQLSASYTWSKAIGICCNDDSDGGPAIQLPEYFGSNRAVTGYDRPHNLQIAGIAELPFGKGKRWMSRRGPASALAGGWQVNAIFSAYSGAPFSVTASGSSLDAPGNTQRADQVKPEVKKLGGVGRGQSFFDPLAFAPVTEARFGTAGFNSLRGPGAVNLDLGLFRELRVKERWQLQFRAEAFNSTNTPHFANPGRNVSNLQLNADGSVRSLGGFTEITGTTGLGREGIDERVFRLGVRISF